MRQRSLQIASYRIEPDTGIVSNGVRQARLEPRAMDVLIYLADKPGEVVSIATLKADIWLGTHVVDEAVKRCISQIRKAFGDDARAPQFIETLPKRGYRLIAPTKRPATKPTPARRANKRASLVAASAALALSAAALWAIGLPIGGAGQMQDAKVDWHQVARSKYHQYEARDMVSAISLYETMIQKDGADYRAYAGLADALMQQYLRWDRDEALAERARQAARRSISLNRRKPDGYKSLGAYHHFRGDLAPALALYFAAVQQDAGYWSAYNNGGEIWRDLGDYDAARAWLRCALGEAPDKASLLSRLADVELRDGHLGQAESHLTLAAQLAPLGREVGETLAMVRLKTPQAGDPMSICHRLAAAPGGETACAMLRALVSWRAGHLQHAATEYGRVAASADAGFDKVSAGLRMALIRLDSNSQLADSEMSRLSLAVRSAIAEGHVTEAEANYLTALMHIVKGEEAIALDALAHAAARGGVWLVLLDIDPAFRRIYENGDAMTMLRSKAAAAIGARAVLPATFGQAAFRAPLCHYRTI